MCSKITLVQGLLCHSAWRILLLQSPSFSHITLLCLTVINLGKRGNKLENNNVQRVYSLFTANIDVFVTTYLGM